MPQKNNEQTDINTRSIDAEKTKLKFTMHSLIITVGIVATSVYGAACWMNSVSNRIDTIASDIKDVKRGCWSIASQQNYSYQFQMLNKGIITVPEVIEPMQQPVQPTQRN